MLSLVAAGLIACAPDAVPGPAFAARPRPVSGGVVYVYRVDRVTTLGRARVRVEGEGVNLSNGEYARIELPAGDHVVALQFRGLPWAWGWDNIPIRLREGEELYLRLVGDVQQTNYRAGDRETEGPDRERFGSTLVRSLVPAEIALAELPGCRLSPELDR